ncbi:hypothetical protein, partial [Pseudomonas aeruginosa]|uniref:hypothetical protein n=1 Tax=Pseudomonas aeruginosa TaxID=287 RepID=UPI00188B5833
LAICGRLERFHQGLEDWTLPPPSFRQLFQAGCLFWMLNAQALAEPIHFSEEVPFLLLDVQRCQDCRELIWLLQPGDLGH